jgi:putative hydrolase of the HAD superfamily
MEKKVTTIIFDWAGVFCSPGEPFSHPLLPKLTGLGVDQLGAETKDLQERYYRGQTSSEEFWRVVIEKFNLTTLTVEDLREAYLNSYTVYHEMLALAETLKKRFTTILLSNLTPEMMDDIITKHDVKRYFHHTIFSNEVGRVKPEPEIFTIALEKAGAKYQETLFIDDGTKNIEAARSLGMRTILFLSPEQCKEELEKLGILDHDHDE